MKGSRSTKALSVVMAAALVLGGMLAGTADAKKKKPKPAPVPAGCPAFVPIEPASSSLQAGEAVEQPVVKITDEHTAEKPLVIEYSHGQAVYLADMEDTTFFNFQIESAQAAPGLFIRQSWAAVSISDMDLYLYDGATGEEATHSGAANAAPMTIGPIPELGNTGQENGAMGFESINGFPVSNCAGYTAESRAFLTPGEDMTLTVWLGEATPTE